MSAARGVNASSYVRAGQSAVDNAIGTIRAARRNAPDYGDIASEGIKQRAATKVAGIKAESEVAQAGIRAEAAVRKSKIEVDRNKSLSRSRATVRKAGKIAAAGMLIGDNITEGKQLARKKAFNQRIFDQQEENARIFEEYLQSRVNDDTAKVKELASATPSLASTTPSSESTPLAIKPDASGKVSQESVYQGLMSRGLSEKDARIGSAVMMGESGGNPTIDTVQSGLDPDKTNEYSIGLMQINTKAHMDKLTRRGLSVDDLRKPETNLDLAVEVFKEAGNKWTPWGAFNNNSYQKFLN
jgi:hypothetical protein